MTYPRLCVPKSRQMSLSWLMCGLYLWESLFFLSRCTLFVSKKEEDAEALCERAMFMYQGLPPFFQNYVKVDRKHCLLQFSNRSLIRGMPQGEDQTRGYTVSGLLFDEAVFNELLAPAIGAAIPAIGLNGKITLISSAGPSTFSDVVFDKF